ncbi:MAG: glycosyltransferase family 2 protein [Paracoccaceae bacterium]
MLARHYAMALAEGRTTSLVRELALADAPNWRRAALIDWATIDPATRGFPEVQAAPHWLDYQSLVARWQRVFGEDAVELRSYNRARFQGTGLVEELRDMLRIEENIGKAPEIPAEPEVPAATLARWRQMNEVFVRLLETGRQIPRQLWAQLLNEVAIDGDPLDPGSLSDLSHRFRTENLDLAAKFPKVGNALTPPPPAKPYTEANPKFGFRATQYAAAFLPRIDQVTKEVRDAAEAARKRRTEGPAEDAATLTPMAEKILSPRAKENFHALRTGRFAPHNRMGWVNEEELAAAFPEAPMRLLPEGRSGNVIVGCMKNEAPYILEWVAYHRMIGVDNFLIYTNGCTDGTDELLDRLQALGIVQRRDNDAWQGNSPQQHALDASLSEPLVEQADWVIHIDVDEFINIRVGDGTLADFFDRVPDATNVAMTWRLFGHNGVERFEDRLVIDQFDQAAPKFCPKPHTAWGFKTMTKNIGAYEEAVLPPAEQARRDPGAADQVGQRLGPRDDGELPRDRLALRHAHDRLRHAAAQPLRAALGRELPRQAPAGPCPACRPRHRAQLLGAHGLGRQPRRHNQAQHSAAARGAGAADGRPGGCPPARGRRRLAQGQGS